MNLNQYDDILEIKNTWISPVYKKLYSKVLEYKPYYTIVRRYIVNNSSYDYFLIMSDNVIPDKRMKSVIQERNGLLKFDLKPYWNVLPIQESNEDVIVSIDIEEKESDICIYRLSI